MKLFVCTASKQLIITLFEKKIVDTLTNIGNNDHSKTLMPLIDNILKKNNLTIKDIDELVVGIGPGSYTGVRIAVVVCKTLALFSNIKLTAVSSLEAKASNVIGVIAPTIIAKKDHVFGGIYNVSDSSITCLVEDKYYEMNDFVKLVEKYKATMFIEDNYDVNPLIFNKKDVDVYSVSPNYAREWTD